ncbi:MAG: ABC transporter permease subunit [Candidatus Kapaibacterium sp.]
MKIIALINDTFKEIYSKKAIVGIFLIEVIILTLTGIVLYMIQGTYANAIEVGERAKTGVSIEKIDSTKKSTDSSELALLGSTDSTTKVLDSIANVSSDSSKISSSLKLPDTISGNLNEQSSKSLIENIVIGQMSAFAGFINLAVLFLGIFISAGIIPSLMEKGTIDIHLSKPISRATLILGRAFGGVIAVGSNVLFFTLGIFVLYGIFSGVWHLPFLLWTISISMFGFCIVYSFILFLNVVTESWILPMSLAYIHVIILSAFLFAREATLFMIIKNPIFQGLINGLYYILPQTSDMTNQLAQATLTGSLSENGFIIQGVVFTIVMIILTIWRFNKKDF